MIILHGAQKARTQSEIDFPPPFGKPEVIINGGNAADVTRAGVVAAAVISRPSRPRLAASGLA